MTNENTHFYKVMRNFHWLAGKTEFDMKALLRVHIGLGGNRSHFLGEMEEKKWML